MGPQRQSPERMYDELDTVFARYNELVTHDPAMTVALLVNMTDSLRCKFNVDVTIRSLGDGKYIVWTDEGETAGFVGFERDDEGRILQHDMPEGMEPEDLPREDGFEDGDTDE